MKLYKFIITLINDPYNNQDIFAVMSDWLEGNYIRYNVKELFNYLQILRDPDNRDKLTYKFLFDIILKFGTRKERKIISKIKRNLRKRLIRFYPDFRKLYWKNILMLEFTMMGIHWDIINNDIKRGLDS